MIRKNSKLIYMNFIINNKIYTNNNKKETQLKNLTIKQKIYEYIYWNNIAIILYFYKKKNKNKSINFLSFNSQRQVGNFL